MTRAKKHLGQHFLRSPKAVAAMVTASEAGPSDTVLEIGPGTGVLTEALLGTGATVIAVEKDADLYPVLYERFREDCDADRLRIVMGDIRDEALIEEALRDRAAYRVVANIPYYLTGLFFRSFLSRNHQPVSMTALIQKEVAERIVARDNKTSLLSLSIAAYGTARYVTAVPARYFSPPPKVDSAIIHISQIARSRFGSSSAEAGFFRVLHAGFAHKRKTIRHNLECVYDKQLVAEALDICKTPPQSRAEECKIEQWVCIARALDA